MYAYIYFWQIQFQPKHIPNPDWIVVGAERRRVYITMGENDERELWEENRKRVRSRFKQRCFTICSQKKYFAHLLGLWIHFNSNAGHSDVFIINIFLRRTMHQGSETMPEDFFINNTATCQFRKWWSEKQTEIYEIPPSVINHKPRNLMSINAITIVKFRISGTQGYYICLRKWMQFMNFPKFYQQHFLWLLNMCALF